MRRGALLIRGPRLHNESVDPGSAEQRYALHRVRDTDAKADETTHHQHALARLMCIPRS
jgi:hypothetical protein